MNEPPNQLERLSLNILSLILKETHVQSLQLSSLEHLRVLHCNVRHLIDARHPHFFFLIHTEFLQKREDLSFKDLLLNFRKYFCQVRSNILSDHAALIYSKRLYLWDDEHLNYLIFQMRSNLIQNLKRGVPRLLILILMGQLQDEFQNMISSILWCE